MKMVELQPEERAVIEAARGTVAPTEIQRARLRRRLDAGIASGLVAPLLVSSTALASVLKIGAVVLVVAAAGTGITFLATAGARHRAPAAQVDPAAPAIVRPLAPVGGPEPPVPSAPARDLVRSIDDRPQPRKPRPHRREATTPAPSDLAGELRLLTEINAAVKRGDVIQGDSLLQTYDRLYPTAELEQERAAAGILLACVAGRERAARADAQRFLSRWPRSPLVARIQASCAGKVDSR